MKSGRLLIEVMTSAVNLVNTEHARASWKRVVIPGRGSDAGFWQAFGVVVASVQTLTSNAKTVSFIYVLSFTCMYMLTICSSSTQRTETSNSGVSPFNIVVHNYHNFEFHQPTLLFTMQHSSFIIQHCCSQ